MAFATASDLAAYLQQDFTAEETATADLALNLATAYVRNVVGQSITQATSTITLHVPDEPTTFLQLPQRPATAVNAVTISGTTVNDYTVLPGTLYRANGWSTGRSFRGAPVTVTVTYTHGYATVPDDIKAACLYVAAQIFANPTGVESVAIDDYRESRATATAGALLPPGLEQTLRAVYGGGAYVT